MNTLKKALSVSLVALTLMACSEKTSLEYMTEAKTLLEQNNTSEAVIELKKAIKQDPKMADARFLLGKVYFDGHNYDSAEKELEKALDNGYDKNKVYPMLLKAYMNNRSYYQLVDLKIDENQLVDTSLLEELNFYKLNAFLNLKQEKEYLELYNSISLTEGGPYARLSHILHTIKELRPGTLGVGKENISTLVTKLDEILEQDAKNQYAMKFKAIAKMLEEDFEETASIYKNYLKYFPADIETKFKYIDLMININKGTEVESIVDELLSANEKHPTLNRFKGIIRYSEKDYEAALSFADKGLVSDTTDVGLRLLAGQSAYSLEKYDVAARNIMLVSNKLDPRHGAMRVLAVSLLNSGDPVEASNVLMSMEGLSERDSLLFSNTSIALIEKGERVRAQKLMDRSKGLSTTSKSLAGRGIVEISLNDMNGIDNLKRAIEQTPEDETAKIALASAYLQTGNFKELSTYLDGWLSSDKDSVQALYFKSQLQLRTKDVKGAKETLEKIVSLDPQNKDAKMNLVNIANASGDNAQAEKLLNEILDQDPGYAPAVAQSYLAKGDNASVDEIKAQIKADPKNIDLKLLLSGIFISQNKLDEALVALDSVEVRKVMPERYWVLRAEIYAKQKKMDLLNETNASWLAQYPANREAVVSSLMALSAQKKYKEALDISSSYLKRQGQNHYVQLLDSHFRVMSGDFSGAETSFGKLPKELASIPFAKGILGRIQVSKKQYKEGLENVKVAYETEKNHDNIRLIYRLSEFLGQKDEAYRLLMTHTEKFPNDYMSLMMLADVQLTKDPVASAANYEQLLTLIPTNVVALNNLANLKMNAGEFAKAEELAKKAVELRSDLSSVVDTLASVYVAQKKHDLALVELRKAIELKDVSHSVYLNYIEALVNTGNKTEAERELYKYNAKFKKDHMRKDLEERKAKLGL